MKTAQNWQGKNKTVKDQNALESVHKGCDSEGSRRSSKLQKRRVMVRTPPIIPTRQGKQMHTNAPSARVLKEAQIPLLFLFYQIDCKTHKNFIYRHKTLWVLNILPITNPFCISLQCWFLFISISASKKGELHLNSLCLSVSQAFDFFIQLHGLNITNNFKIEVSTWQFK